MKKEISNKKAVIALIVIALLLVTLGMVYANFFANKKESNDMLSSFLVLKIHKLNLEQMPLRFTSSTFVELAKSGCVCSWQTI